MQTSDRKFAVFILTHGRPNNVITYQTLRSCGYTGNIYIIIDNEDLTVNEYRKVFDKDEIIIFDKKAIGETFDLADTRKDRRATVFARNASFQIAESLGLSHFIELDDDYTSFMFRTILDGGKFGHIDVRSLDEVFAAMADFLDVSGASSVAMAQGGDFIGGAGNKNALGASLLRKCMNSWLCRTDRPFTFVGRMNDDVNTYVINGTRGSLFFTTTKVMLTQPVTQAVAGGMSDMYLDTGTYMKSFYTVMMCPSSVKVGIIRDHHERIHHRVNWNNTVPKIISEKHKKK